MNTSEGQNNYNNSLESAGQVDSSSNINKLELNRTEFGEVNNLAKVRDILFGNQMREVEKRFTRLEERLLKECANLRDEQRKRLDSLEIYIKQEVESLTERLKHEQTERNEALITIKREHDNITGSLEKKLTEFDEQTVATQRELREQILNQSQSLQDDIRQKSEEILALLKREAEELRAEKTDRSSLAALFTELAIRINSR